MKVCYRYISGNLNIEHDGMGYLIFIVFSGKPKEGFLINKNNYHPLTNIITLP